MSERLTAVRARTRQVMRREIAAVGMRLFITQGFQQTTADQIAAAAGISRRSFFRYFETKEDVLFTEFIARGERVANELAERPANEKPWPALRHALLATKEALPPIEDELEIGRLVFSTPTLHARHLEKQLAWRAFLEPEIARRIEHQDGVPPDTAHRRAAAVVACALSCLDTASTAWITEGGSIPIETLYDEAVQAVRS
jgi:AcrR family transcriptional regulator